MAPIAQVGANITHTKEGGTIKSKVGRGEFYSDKSAKIVLKSKKKE